jgi:hypothetical protein
LVRNVGPGLWIGSPPPLPRVPEDPEAVDEIVRLMEVYTESVERILGVESGRLHLIDEAMMKVIRGV